MKDKIRPEYPRLVFYIRKTKKNPSRLISKETYDELNSYEPMMYRPENWERFNEQQKKSHEECEKILEENGHIFQAEKFVVSSKEEFLKLKKSVEEHEDFEKWITDIDEL